MSTEKDLMKLVADYGKECISAGIAEMSLSDALKQRMAEDVRKSHEALTARLRALLAELDAARDDAARWQEVAFGSSPFLGVFYVDNFGNERMLCEQEAVDVVDAARKGGGSMNRDDVMRMAEQAGASFYDGAPGNCIIQCVEAVLERFAALVAAAERRKHQADIEHWKTQAAQAEKWRALALSKDKRNAAKIVQKIQREAMELERDACAKVCEARYLGDNNREDMEAKACAAAIRARGNQ